MLLSVFIFHVPACLAYFSYQVSRTLSYQIDQHLFLRSCIHINVVENSSQVLQQFIFFSANFELSILDALEE